MVIRIITNIAQHFTFVNTQFYRILVNDKHGMHWSGIHDAEKAIISSEIAATSIRTGVNPMAPFCVHRARDPFTNGYPCTTTDLSPNQRANRKEPRTRSVR
jgi:hypothetical protein